jgi:hypothetical protein
MNCYATTGLTTIYEHISNGETNVRSYWARCPSPAAMESSFVAVRLTATIQNVPFILSPQHNPRTGI